MALGICQYKKKDESLSAIYDNIIYLQSKSADLSLSVSKLDIHRKRHSKTSYWVALRDMYCNKNVYMRINMFTYAGWNQFTMIQFEIDVM